MDTDEVICDMTIQALGLVPGRRGLLGDPLGGIDSKEESENCADRPLNMDAFAKRKRPRPDRWSGAEPRGRRSPSDVARSTAPGGRAPAYRRDQYESELITSPLALVPNDHQT